MYITQDVSFRRDKLNIYGKLFAPEVLSEVLTGEKASSVGGNFGGKADEVTETIESIEAAEEHAEEATQAPFVKFPGIIFSHGYGGTGVTGTFYARALAEKGYAVLCIDFCGGGEYSKSDGSPLELSLMTEAEDIAAAVRYMCEQSFIDSRRIFLLGESLGGMASALYANEHPELFKGLMLLYPGFCFREIVKGIFKSFDEVPESYAYLPNLTVGRRFAEDIWDFDIYEHIAGYRRPVLIIHGNADSLVDVSYSVKAAEVYPDAELHIIDKAEHGFRGADFRQAMGYIDKYLEKADASQAKIH